MSLYRADNILERVGKSLVTWKSLIMHAHPEGDNRKTEQLEKLETFVKEYSVIETNYQRSKDALEKLDEKLSDSTEKADIDEMYQQCLNELPGSSNYQKSNIWETFHGRSDIMEVHKKNKKLKDSEYDELEESMFCANVFTPPVDPISKAIITVAYRNKVCGHVYEYDTIANYIESSKKKAKCPYIGCNNNNLKISQLKEDKALQDQIKQYLENQENASSGSDED
ncbi:unnamed protein product [Phyllotreta striolata]|uniref:E3 SUMO-protein ligase NSE2 n=1 Tax=Phyllotreta striolata TaxID=444603 RepID=A0A9N9XPH8_PHYSR|nr:unnamed protein product [Phyllotreta striolata]